MISKNEVKYIQSLSDKKNRDQHNVFVAEGPKLISELLENAVSPVIIYTTKKRDAYDRTKFEVREISASDLQRISSFEKANEVVGIFRKHEPPKLRLEQSFTLLLDGIQDPGNLGTIIRTADWFGVTQIVASHDSADCFNAKVVQSTMGSIARITVYYEDLQNLLATATMKIMGARLHGKSLAEVEPVTEGILIIGNESKGIRPEIVSFIRDTITIPRSGKAESLNAAVATGILLSHLVKK